MNYTEIIFRSVQNDNVDILKVRKHETLIQFVPRVGEIVTFLSGIRYYVVDVEYVYEGPVLLHIVVYISEHRNSDNNPLVVDKR